MKKLVVLVASLLLAGCASSGVRVTDAQLSQFHAGQTTEQQVIATLGTPTMQMHNSDGTSTLMYTYAEARARPSSFIPVVGIFAGGVDSHSNSAMLTFDKNGVLQRYSTSQGENGTAAGIAVDGGAPVADQPRK